MINNPWIHTRVSLIPWMEGTPPTTTEYVEYWVIVELNSGEQDTELATFDGGEWFSPHGGRLSEIGRTVLFWAYKPQLPVEGYSATEPMPFMMT